MIGKRGWLLVLVILLALAAPCAAQSVDEALDEIAGNFTVWDWLVIVVYLIFTTVLGGLLAGKQASMKDFFVVGGCPGLLSAALSSPPNCRPRPSSSPRPSSFPKAGT